jgi:hypothetical protein
MSTSLAIIIGCVLSTASFAKVSETEAKKLGAELTPMGAEKAGNADGTIPEWTGGLTQGPEGYTKGMHHPDPFKDDKVEFTITASNADQYKDSLSEGQLALLKTYPDTYKMKVYPTHRSASAPQRLYDATKQNAVNTELVGSGNGFTNAKEGVPFPIPQNGVEVIWNHMSRYRGEAVERISVQVTPTRSGDYTPIKMREHILFSYGTQTGAADEENMLFYFKQQVESPARLAGTALLVHEPINQIETPRQAWSYNTGQRRVRRAPNIAYDAPGTAADGLRTTDNFDMFNGAPDRYDWTLVGKKEMYIPYNAYTLHSNNVQVEDIVKPGHINMEFARYEKHRVWVVEANLKPNTRHIYKKRVFYVDEDSWQIVLVDHYDNRDELWRVGEAHPVNFYDVPIIWSTLDVFYDLQSRRYLAMGLDNQEEMLIFDKELSVKDFTPQALRRDGVR